VNTVRIYSRHGCHLCDDAISTINSMKNELLFEVEIAYIDGDTELEKLYGNEVPVIHINGEHHDFYKVDPDRFKASLERHRQHQ
jgi:glutaredoxin